MAQKVEAMFLSIREMSLLYIDVDQSRSRMYPVRVSLRDVLQRSQHCGLCVGPVLTQDVRSSEVAPGHGYAYVPVTERSCSVSYTHLTLPTKRIV